MNKNCCVCNGTTAMGFCFVNGKGRKEFQYINESEAAHIECYIDLCVKNSLLKQGLKVNEPT